MAINYSKYPYELDDSDSLPITVDDVSRVDAEVVNRLRSSVIAIEREAGIDPSGSYGTIRERLDAMDSGLGAGTIEVLDNGITALAQATSLDFVGNVSVSVPEPLRARITISGGTASCVEESIAVSTNGQTAFTLSQVPIQPSSVQMYLNGLKLQRGVEYSSSNDIVSYSGSIPLSTTDVVEFWYLVDIGSIGSASASAKIRLYRSSTQAGTAVTTNQTVIWDSVSPLVASSNASQALGNTAISVDRSGHFIVSGQISLQIVEDAVSGITIEIVQNGAIIVQTISDYGAVWSSGVTRSFSFCFPIDLLTGDDLIVRWRHSGTVDSTTQLMSGDSLSWFALSSLG